MNQEVKLYLWVKWYCFRKLIWWLLNY